MLLVKEGERVMEWGDQGVVKKGHERGLRDECKGHSDCRARSR